jgi:hypothetical protein
VNGLLAIGGLLSAGLLAIAFLVGTRTKPSVLLVRVEEEMSALRAEVAGYWSAHEHLAESLERRLDDLELTTARAANEVRMASDQVIAHLPAERAAVIEEAP